MSVTFEVSDVRVAQAPIRDGGRRHLAVIRDRVGNAEAGRCNLDGLVGSTLHPFVEAVHLAFDRHYPLVLSPDDVWLCIAQGFAHHVELHHEELRGRFVRHDGQAKIVVTRDEFVKGSPSNDWPGVFDELSQAIAKHIGKQRDLVVADFSTTGAIEKAASEVVLMAAMRHYFEYEVVTLCGIPRITLLGTPDDWASIRRRVHHLAEYGLEKWVAALELPLRELCAAAAGKPDRAMWQSFYKLHSRSGGDAVTGWINTLFPYLTHERSSTREWNCHVNDWADGGGPEPITFGNGLSVAPFTWNYLGSLLPMDFVAGFMSVAQDAALAVRPAIGWAVRDRPQ